MRRNIVLMPATAMLAAVVYLAGCGAAVDSIASDDLGGTAAHCFQDIALDDFHPIEFNADRLLVKGPSVVGFEGPRAIIEFETSVPTPAAVVRFGPCTLVGDVREALFRKVAGERLESGETATVHRVEVNVSKLESSSYDLYYIEDGEERSRTESRSTIHAGVLQSCTTGDSATPGTARERRGITPSPRP